MSSNKIEQNTGIHNENFDVLVFHTHKYKTSSLFFLSKNFEKNVNKEIKLTSFHTFPCAKRG